MFVLISDQHQYIQDKTTLLQECQPVVMHLKAYSNVLIKTKKTMNGFKKQVGGNCITGVD